MATVNGRTQEAMEVLAVCLYHKEIQTLVYESLMAPRWTETAAHVEPNATGSRPPAGEGFLEGGGATDLPAQAWNERKRARNRPPAPIRLN